MPLAELGYGSVSLMQAYYGKRKPHDQVQHFNRTCWDYAIGLISAILEVTKLLKWLEKEYPGIPVGVCGVSMGGATVSAVSTLFQGDMIVVPCLASHSLKELFEAPTLGAMLSAQGLKDREVRQACFLLLDELQLSTLVKAKKRRGEESDDYVRVTRFVRAKRDKFVPHRDSQAAASCLEAISTKFDIVEVPGGHVSTIKNSTKHVVPQVVLAFEALKIHSRLKDSV